MLARLRGIFLVLAALLGACYGSSFVMDTVAYRLCRADYVFKFKVISDIKMECLKLPVKKKKPRIKPNTASSSILATTLVNRSTRTAPTPSSSSQTGKLHTPTTSLPTSTVMTAAPSKTLPGSSAKRNAIHTRAFKTTQEATNAKSMNIVQDGKTTVTRAKIHAKTMSTTPKPMKAKKLVNAKKTNPTRKPTKAKMMNEIQKSTHAKKLNTTQQAGNARKTNTTQKPTQEKKANTSQETMSTTRKQCWKVPYQRVHILKKDIFKGANYMELMYVIKVFPGQDYYEGRLRPGMYSKGLLKLNQTYVFMGRQIPNLYVKDNVFMSNEYNVVGWTTMVENDVKRFNSKKSCKRPT